MEEKKSIVTIGMAQGWESTARVQYLLAQRGFMATLAAHIEHMETFSCSDNFDGIAKEVEELSGMVKAVKKLAEDWELQKTILKQTGGEI